MIVCKFSDEQNEKDISMQIATNTLSTIKTLLIGCFYNLSPDMLPKNNRFLQAPQESLMREYLSRVDLKWCDGESRDVCHHKTSRMAERFYVFYESWKLVY